MLIIKKMDGPLRWTVITQKQGAQHFYHKMQINQYIFMQIGNANANHYHKLMDPKVWLWSMLIYVGLILLLNRTDANQYFVIQNGNANL